MTFRLAQPTDHASVRRMIVDTFEPITWMKEADQRYGPFNGLDWRERFGRRVDPLLERGIVLLGEDAGEIQAAAAGSYDPGAGTGVIDFLAVDPRHQGHGLGRAMLNGMLRHFALLGATTATLECLTTNEPALTLYRSAGWTEVATSIRFFRRLDGILEEIP
jgi:ribosomal protein S18 acetylase RimI-like enzyme